MRGFLSIKHYGHTCFIREDYEAAHAGEDELQRLEDALGMSFSDWNTAMYYALTHARHLLYRCQSDEIDAELLRGRDPWIAFQGGYVHVVTGEFVYGAKPMRDSYPCWRREEPAGTYFSSTSPVQVSGVLGLAACLFGFLATLLGGKR